MASPNKPINLDTCSPQQLEQLHQVMNQELQMMTSSLGTLNLALNKYRASKEAIGGLKSAKEETKETLVPLTSSLYVAGKIKNVKSVLIDVGTGYFVEKSVEDAEKFFDEKIEMITSNLDQINKTIAAKRQDLIKIRAALNHVIGQRAKQQQQQQQKTSAK